MNCKEAKILLAPHTLDDLDNEPSRCKELQAHLLCCPNCAEMYDGFKETIGFVLEHKAEFAQAFENARAREKKIDVPIPSTASFPKIRKILIKASAVAACLVIGVFIWLVFSHYSKPNTFPRTSSSEQVASVLKPSVKVELVRPSGNIVIATGQKIVADNELKTLLINGKHRMVMNTYTALAVEPLLKHSNIGCLVKLDSGQIYTHVQYDGNPFIVGTAHGRAMITGTIFDVKARNDSTTLVVSEGTVQFESENGVVEVAAGQMSKIVGQSTPSIPLSCNTAELTVWATGCCKVEPVLTKTESTFPGDFDLPEFSLSELLARKPIDLENIDYDEWIEEKREWFKQQFLWIFQLQEVLVTACHGEAFAKTGQMATDIPDYPELLLQIADIGKIVYQDGCYQRIPIEIDPTNLLSKLEGVDINKDLIEEALSIQRSPVDASESRLTGPDILDRWLITVRDLKTFCRVNEAKTEALCDYSMAACEYIENTRTLLWLSIRNNKYHVDLDKGEMILELLEKVVERAYDCKKTAWQLNMSQAASCSERYVELRRNLIAAVEAICECDRQIRVQGWPHTKSEFRK